MLATLKGIAPRGGWRAFAGEVGVIVLGVLIAVGIGKVAEAIDWRGKVADARITLDTDIRDDNWFDMTERLLVTPCLRRQLDRLHAVTIDTTGTVSRAFIRGSSYPYGALVFPSRAWTSDAWESVVADGVPSHMAPAENTFYRLHYLAMPELQAMNREEVGDVADLAVLGEVTALDPVTRATLLRGLARERVRVDLMGLIAGQRRQALKASGRNFHVPARYFSAMRTLTWCRANGLA